MLDMLIIAVFAAPSAIVFTLVFCDSINAIFGRQAIDISITIIHQEKTMNKFTVQQSPEETTAAAIYDMQEEFRKEEESKDIPIHEQFGCTVEEWNRTCDAWDARHDMYGLRGMQASLILSNPLNSYRNKTL